MFLLLNILALKNGHAQRKYIIHWWILTLHGYIPPIIYVLSQENEREIRLYLSTLNYAMLFFALLEYPQCSSPSPYKKWLRFVILQYLIEQFLQPLALNLSHKWYHSIHRTAGKI